MPSNSIDLDNWLKDKNAVLSENGVKINTAKELDKGKYQLELSVSNLDTIASLEQGFSSNSDTFFPTGKDASSKLVKPINTEFGSIRYKPELTRSDLKLNPVDYSKLKPQEIYKRSIEYYKYKDIYGSVIDILTNFASKGFRNDIDDPAIKQFFDIWGYSVGLNTLIEQIFFDFFRVGIVKTYKVVGRYIPSISFYNPTSTKSGSTKDTSVGAVFGKIHDIYESNGYLDGSLYTKKNSANIIKKINSDIADLLNSLPTEHAAKKIKWSKNFIPIGYTILNPTQIDIVGSLFSGDQLLVLNPDEDLKKFFEIENSQLTDKQKQFRDQLPSDFKQAIKDGKPAPLNPYLVGSVEYRRQPYERWPMPRGLRAFDSILLKDALRLADWSTVDGINNYILKVTIGSDAHPVSSQEQLDTVAEVFNTPQKAFQVFYNHTLKVEKITSPEIAQILGSEKYAQVDKDITGALAVVRALIDGDSTASAGALDLASKSLIEEVSYARRQVENWLYNEYRDIAEGMGFDKFPQIRFDDMALKDEAKMTALVQGMIDRRIMSYQSGIELLGFDYPTILSELKDEKSLVLDGTLGVIGSPYNPKATPQLVNDSAPSNVQPTQKTPKGTPSEGRPVKGFGKSKEAANTGFFLLEKGLLEKADKSDLDNAKIFISDVGLIECAGEAVKIKGSYESICKKAQDFSNLKSTESKVFSAVGKLGNKYIYKYDGSFFPNESLED